MTMLFRCITLSLWIASAVAFIPAQPNSLLLRLDSVLYGKSPDRARMERELEEAMGDDWRLFRAKLVAQEAQAQANTVPPPPRAQRRVRSSSAAFVYKNGEPDETFGAAVRSMIRSIGLKSPTVPDNFIEVFEDSLFFDIPKEDILSQDPFVSKDELPIHIKPKRCVIDKHRWAHHIEHLEPGCVLIASPKSEGEFHHAVVLIVDYEKKDGATGFIINRPLEGDLNEITLKEDSTLALSLKMAFASSPVNYGGPESPGSFSILHGYGLVEGAKKVAPGVFIGGSMELMKEVESKRYDAKKVLFIKGNSVWKAGEVEQELQMGLWYIAAASSDFLLRYAGAPITEADNPTDLWSDILTCMGGNYVPQEYCRRLLSPDIKHGRALQPN